MFRLFLFLAFFGLIIYGLYWWIRHSFHRAMKSFFPDKEKETKQVEKLIQCALCQTFIPQSKAIQTKGAYYCCEEHANQRK